MMMQTRNVTARQLTRFRMIAAVLLTCIAMTPVTQAADDEESVVAVKAGTVHVGNGESIQDGIVLISGESIQAVGADIAIPDGADVYDMSDATITPGLIDANAFVDPASLVAQDRASEIAAQAEEDGRGNFLHTMFGDEHDIEDCAVCSPDSLCALAAGHDELAQGDICPVCGYGKNIWGHFAPGTRPGLVLSETSSEVVPHTHVIDSMNLRTPDFDRLLRGGVTTVFASPDNSVVIGPRGMITRTGGPIRERVLEPSGAVTAIISSDAFRGSVRNRPPYRFRVDSQTRRPNTRMGLGWVFRKAFYDAIRHREGQPVYGADTPPEQALPVLNQILEGEIPLRMHARQQNDIQTAVRLANEFDLEFTLLEGTEAHHCLDLLREEDIPVVYGPIYVDPSGQRTRTAESRDARLSTMSELLNAGIDTALSAQDLREESGLSRQMMYAVRTGVSPEDAIRAATSTPARLLGLDDHLGTLEAGKKAELVVWSRPPYEAGAVPVMVIIDGQVVLDRRTGS